jgi:hypothetical protein
MLGEFEYVLITTAARLGENAYGVAIRQEIETAVERNAPWARCTTLWIAWKKKVSSKRGWVKQRRSVAAGANAWCA